MIYDVAIAGFGPAGATAACLLGALGLRTLVVERATGVYDKPRAFSMDHEVMRVFQNVGLADAIQPFVAPFSASEHYGVEGQLIRRLTMIDPPYPLGWTPSMVFLQPPFEAALRAHATATPGVEAALGEELLSFVQDADQVRLTLGRDGATREVVAKYLIGCDGASSGVRRALSIAQEDLDFDEPWLVVDVRVNARGAAKLPKTSAQFCEPARPTSFLIGVGEHRRWEIMLLPGETPEEMETDAAVWRLLGRWLSPEDGTLWRYASYRFHALVASRWREGRVFLAGDAAHQQPPFLGQGMCQGIRDVANLAWKLAAVLQGRAGEALLDTYEMERSAHVKRLTTTIKGIGRNICERDEARARTRDADLVAQAGGAVKSVPRQDLIPPLETGLISPAPHAANGTLFPQPRVRHQGGSALLDEVAGHGLRLMLSADCPVEQGLLLAAVRRCGAEVVRIGAGALEEEHGIAAAWFARHGVSAALVRPDNYVYGVASTLEGIESLAASYQKAIHPGDIMSSLTLAQANQIISVALARARSAGHKPMGIAVVDEAGALKAFAREDGASMLRFEIAQAKAWGAVGMGVASRVLGERAKDNPNFFVSLAATAHGKFLPQTGAVVIKDTAGVVIGAVGASGGTGDEDEAICIAGVEAAGLAHG